MIRVCRIMALIVVLIVLGAVAAVAATKPINWEPINNVLAAVTAASPFLMAILYLKWPKAAVTAAKILAMIDPAKIKVIQEAIDSKTIQGPTFQEFVVRLSTAKGWHWSAEEINAVLTLLGPQAKKIGWTIK